jgi:hypothetical protein
VTKSQALALARRKWGKVAALRERVKAAAKSEREQASRELREYRASKPSAFPSVDAEQEWKRRESLLISRALSYRCSVGYMSTRFSVVGKGDTWENACRGAGLL